MSFSGKTRNDHADREKGFPIDPAADVSATFADIIADAIRRDFGTSPAKVKHLARLTGSNARTVQNWIYARNGPSGAALIVLMRHSDAVTLAVLSLAERDELRRGVSLVRASGNLRSAIDALLPHLDHNAD